MTFAKVLVVNSVYCVQFELFRRKLLKILLAANGDFSPPTSLVESHTTTELIVGSFTEDITLNDLWH